MTVSPTLTLALTLTLTSAFVGAAAPFPSDAGAPSPAPATTVHDYRALRAAAVASLDKARVAAPADDVSRTITLPSIELLIDDADTRAATITNPARDWAFVREQLETARAYADRLATGADPYRGATGMMVKAYRDEFDQTLQPYALALPSGPAPAAGWPLLVSLHGAYSNHRLNLRRVFGKSNRPGENDEEASRNHLPLPEVPMIVVSPFGRGEFMGFQGLGERDVLRVLADVRRAYAVDPDRIYLTGLSMGGEGTWTIGLRHPDLFAALVPVCGVTDARQWIGADAVPYFDPTLLGLTNQVAIADNAANLTVIFYHGDRDPTVKVGNSRAMADRYRQLGWLGKNVRYFELPGVDHFAWVPAYRDAAIFPLLAGVRRDPFPAHVVYKTPTIRYNQAYWLRIDQIDDGLALAGIEGDQARGKFTVRPNNISAFSLLLDAKHVPRDRAITVSVGDATLYQGPPRPVLSFARAGASWQAVAWPPPTPKGRPDHGSSGLFSRALARERPHIYVFGTAGSPELTAANQALARAMGDWGPGVRAHFTVKADRDVTPGDIRDLDLVLVGGPRSNTVARQLASELPVDDRADRLVAGNLTLTDADRAYRVTCPNPLAPGHQILLYAADTARGLTAFQRFARGNAAAHGPESNLDYLVFDGAGKIRASGVFRDRCRIGQ
jgi:dienelactone hydrolase